MIATRTRLASALLVLLGGCAIDPVKLQQMAVNTPTDELCYIRVSARFTGQVRQAAFTELGNRREDCSHSWQYVNTRMQSEAQQDAAAVAQQQANTAALQAAQRSFVQPAPLVPLIAPTTTVCRPVGNTVVCQAQ